MKYISVIIVRLHVHVFVGQQYGNQGQTQAPGWGQQFQSQQIFNDPMASMAMHYGTSLAGQGKDIVSKNVREREYTY